MSINDNYMNKNEQEQYSFGPWLVVIDSIELIPPQYLDFQRDIMDAEFAIKVPVNKDRKDVTPGMLMYKEVLVFNEGDITILKSTNSRIVKEVVSIKDINFIIRGGELLHNYITIGTKNQLFTIKYYSVSYEINSKIVSFVRDYFQDGRERQIRSSMQKDYSENDLYKFFGKSNHQADEFYVVGHQKDCFIPMYPDSVFNRIRNIFKRKHIDEVLFLASEHELVIISGDIDRATKSSVDYSYRHIYVKLDRVNNMSMIQDDHIDGLNTLQFLFGKSRIRVNVEDSFDRQYLRGLFYSY